MNLLLVFEKLRRVFMHVDTRAAAAIAAVAAIAESITVFSRLCGS